MKGSGTRLLPSCVDGQSKCQRPFLVQRIFLENLRVEQHDVFDDMDGDMQLSGLK